MKNMEEVYKKLKKDFRKVDIKFDKDKEQIEINNNGYEIISNINMIELSKGLKYLNHKKPTSFEEVYRYTKRYIKDPDGSFRSLNRQRLIAFLIALVLTIIIGFFLEIAK